MRILVDTNVFLDCFLKRDEGDAELFFHNCYTLSNSIYVTSMSLRDIEYSLHRMLHNQELSKKYQRATYSICDKVIGISADAAIESLYSETKDYEDSLQSFRSFRFQRNQLQLWWFYQRRRFRFPLHQYPC